MQIGSWVFARSAALPRMRSRVWCEHVADDGDGAEARSADTRAA